VQDQHQFDHNAQSVECLNVFAEVLINSHRLGLPPVPGLAADLNLLAAKCHPLAELRCAPRGDDLDPVGFTLRSIAIGKEATTLTENLGVASRVFSLLETNPT
jgi:hypothetical protein